MFIKNSRSSLLVYVLFIFTSERISIAAFTLRSYHPINTNYAPSRRLPLKNQLDGSRLYASTEKKNSSISGRSGSTRSNPKKSRDNKNNNPKNTDQSKRRKLTSIEKANQDYKAKRLRERFDRQWKFIESKIKANEPISQRLCDEAMSLCAAADEWDMYNYIVENLMEGQQQQQHHDLSMLPSTYRACLKECFAVGNGQSAIRIFQSMGTSDAKKKIVDWEGRDFDHVLGAICKHDYGYDVPWEIVFGIIEVAADHYQRINKDCDIKVETYNHVFSRMEGNEKLWDEALQLLSKMDDTPNNVQLHPKPNLATYHATLNVLISSNQLDKAMKLLLSLQGDKQPKPSTYTFEIVLSALTKNDYRGAKYKQAMQIIQSMISLNIPVPIEMYNRVISSCAKAKKATDAMALFRKMKERRVQPDTVTYNSLISACAKEGLSKDAFRLFEECRNSDNVQPDVITYTSAIRACGKSRMSKRALKLLSDAKRDSIPLDVFLYTAVIDVCAKDKQWRKALDLMADMKRNNVIANQHTYSAVINALGNSGQWERALDVLDQMKEKEMKVNVVAYNSAISALAKASRSTSTNDHTVKLWEKALGLINQMKKEKVWPDKYSYSSAIACCASDARYQEALDLIEVMRNGPAKIRPNRISYTGAMTACARAGEWSHALRLFSDMKVDRIEYDVVAYNALVSSFQNGGKPQMAYDVWNEMCGKSESTITGMNLNQIKIRPDIITLTNVIASLERAEDDDNLSKMDAVFDDAVERQIIFSEDSMDTLWEIDLSGMSIPVARAACRHIMNKRLLQKTSEQCEDLMLITGVGKHQQKQAPLNDDDDSNAINRVSFANKQSGTALREYVRQVLREDFEPPLYSVIPKGAAGTVQVNKEVIEQWMTCQKR